MDKVSESLTSEKLGKISKFARRELSADEIYVFPVVLCDNEIDRDGERFSISALKKLSELFIGKTGIFDHNPKRREFLTLRLFRTARKKQRRERLILTSELRRTWSEPTKMRT